MAASLFRRRPIEYKNSSLVGKIRQGDSTIRVFRPLRHKNYALFGSSDFIASIGQFVREIALYWLAYEITGSAMALGILALCDATPRLVLSVVGGVIVDRCDRLRLLTAIQFLCMVPVFTMVALYF